jgi:hypothetical protein
MHLISKYFIVTLLYLYDIATNHSQLSELKRNMDIKIMLCETVCIKNLQIV